MPLPDPDPARRAPFGNAWAGPLFAPMKRTLVGRLERTRFGYGFVRVDDGGEDLFIPPFAMAGALHGDRVRVGFLEAGARGDAHEVVEVLERTRYGIVGRFEGRGRTHVALHPERPEYPREILLTLHGRARVPAGARVVVRLHPVPPDPLVGAVEKVFAEDDPREDSLLVALEEGIRTEFDPEAETEAAAFREDSVAHAARHREDFRDRLVLTIDPEDAQDHDDALSVEAKHGGLTTVGIHIADVTHYVRPGTALDREAQERGSSVYLADTTFPMLPRALSSGLCSLSDGVDRLTVTVLADLDDQGSLRGARVVEGVIRSRASLSYPEAHRLIRDERGEIPDALRALDRLAKALRKRRLERGGLELDLPEIKPELDPAGHPVAFDEAPRLPTHELIEEFMLLANQIVGDRARARELPFLYRVHERPRYDKLRSFFEAARYLGKQGPAQIVTDAKQLRRFVSHGSTAKDRLLNLYLLRALEKARYDLVDVGHFGLGMAAYAHFTSPIRRYPDLANHRIVKRFLLEEGRPGGDPWAYAEGWLSASVAARSSDAEIAADDAERDVDKRKAVRFALLRLGEETEGVIAGLSPGGVFVWLPEWHIEGFLPKRSLGDPSLTLAEHGFSFRSKRSRHRFGLGDSIAVTVARADLDRREVELGLAPRGEGRGKRRAKKPRLVRRAKGRRGGRR